MNKISISLATIIVLMSGCGEKPEESGSTTELPKEQAVPAVENTPVQNLYGTSAQPQQQSQSPEGTDMQTNGMHVAKVIETVDAAGYTYVKVDENGQVYWIAGPKSDVSVGSSISYIEQMMMKDFTSKTLGKSFDFLMFTSTIIPAGKPADTAMTAGSPKAHDCEECGSSDQTPSTAKKEADTVSHYSGAQTAQKVQEQAEPITVAKAEGGYSVEELYAKKADLKGQKVKLHAKVVKVSKNIMGKDWIHLQDGTGVAASTNDLIATAVNTTVNVGDTVTAQGIINTDVDLGYGYFFSVILEESTFTK